MYGADASVACIKAGSHKLYEELAVLIEVVWPIAQVRLQLQTLVESADKGVHLPPVRMTHC